jgi:hypothetical protein
MNLVIKNAAEAIIAPPINKTKLAYKIVINLVGVATSFTIIINIDRSKNDAIINT